LGAQALGGGLAGSNNTVLGYQAGYNNAGNSNVFIGHQAGFNAAGDNLLYIANDSTATPLIYGEFDNAVVTINGDLNVAGELDIDFEIISSGLITMNTAWGGSGNYNGATAYWGGALATCPSGKYAIGGSCSTTHVIRTNISNAYISGVDSFQCYANSENNVEQLIAFVHCARLK
jgi:hypothetical protein